MRAPSAYDRKRVVQLRPMRTLCLPRTYRAVLVTIDAPVRSGALPPVP